VKPDRFGISDPHWALITRLLVDPIKSAGGSVSIFGSRSRGDFRQFSDLDVLVEGPVSPSLLSSVSERLEESPLPLRVDIVLESDLADSYRPGVLRDKVRVA
jgi:hypothetical protein